MPLTIRAATQHDLPAMREIMQQAIRRSQSSFLTENQIEASHAIMGLDTQLIKDQTYFLVVEGRTPVGCGGWSRRATLYGGDHSVQLREPRSLDPDSEPARIRAMYTHPDHTRRGVGRLILSVSEQAARQEGFRSIELMSTLSGRLLYHSCGYEEIECTAATIDGIAVPLVRMGKDFL